MNKKLYNMMDWAAIEEIVYAESVHPEEILGPVNVGRNTLVQAFFPGAKEVSLCVSGKDGKVKEEIKMEMADEEGFFAQLLTGKDRNDYYYHVTYADKKRKARDVHEVYGRYTILTEKDRDLIMSGSDSHVYEKLGSHRRTINGKRGTAFTVWAPEACRVSLVGDFNNWDGRECQMIRNDETGIFELFIPCQDSFERYKYEILIKGGEKILKSDPYAVITEGDEGSASVVASSQSLNYKWTDDTYMENRTKGNRPVNIYEICPSLYTGKGTIKSATAPVIAHMKKFGYTHVELMPVAEYYNDSLGYKPSCIFTVDHKIGTAKDLMHFVNALHKEGFGVIMQWVCSYFDEGPAGIGYFDGTCLYEHEDPRKGIDARNGGKIYQFGNRMVAQYLISNALFWLREFHFDGIKVCDVSSMLYLDYYRQDGQWVPNIYGGNENLEAVSFIKRLNKYIHREMPEVMTIAEEESGWPYVSVTDDMNEEERNNCLGFDYVADRGFNSDMIPYMESDPINRAAIHSNLSLSLLYQYREKYIVGINHGNLDFGKAGLISRMPGSTYDKYANLRCLYGYIMTRPGLKTMFMGQDQANPATFDGLNHLNVEADEDAKCFGNYVSALNNLYINSPALNKLDFDAKGFGWVNNDRADTNVIAFVRNSDKENEQLLVVINFANAEHAGFRIGTPLFGKYKLVFTSDDKKFGGSSQEVNKIIGAKPRACDGFEQSLTLRIPPLSFNVYAFVPFTGAEQKAMDNRRKEREQLMKQRDKQRKALSEEKAKIRASLRATLEQKYREAEAAIENGSEYKKNKK